MYKHFFLRQWRWAKNKLKCLSQASFLSNLIVVTKLENTYILWEITTVRCCMILGHKVAVQNDDGIYPLLVTNKEWDTISSFFWCAFFLCLGQDVLEYFTSFCNMICNQCNTICYKKGPRLVLSCRLVNKKLWISQRIFHYNLTPYC